LFIFIPNSDMDLDTYCVHIYLYCLNLYSTKPFHAGNDISL